MTSSGRSSVVVSHRLVYPTPCSPHLSDQSEHVWDCYTRHNVAMGGNDFPLEAWRRIYAWSISRCSQRFTGKGLEEI